MRESSREFFKVFPQRENYTHLNGKHVMCPNKSQVCWPHEMSQLLPIVYRTYWHFFVPNFNFCRYYNTYDMGLPKFFFNHTGQIGRFSVYFECLKATVKMVLNMLEGWGFFYMTCIFAVIQQNGQLSTIINIDSTTQLN